MSWNPVLTFCGTWLFLLTILNQNGRVLGQQETLAELETLLQDNANSSSSNQNQQAPEKLDHEACPCMASTECPRIYGSNPLDFTEIGEVQPCQETGFVRCCGVSVTVVQRTDESVEAGGGGVEQDMMEGRHETTAEEHESDWVIVGESQDESGSNESSSNKDDNSAGAGDADNDHPDLHESQGQVEGKQWEAEATEPLPADSNNEKSDGDFLAISQKTTNVEEQSDELITSESNQDAGTVIIKPARSRNPKFQRRNRPTPTYQRTQSSVSPYDYVPQKSEDTKPEYTLKEDGISIEALSEVKGPETSNIVYSQRVTNHSPYQQGSNFKNAVAATDTNYDVVSKNDNDYDRTSTAAHNGKFRPRAPTPMRKKRPFSQMRNRPEQEEEDKKSSVEDTPVVQDESQVYGTSSSGGQSPASSLHVASLETAEKAQDELGDERRVVSKLVRPKVAGLSRLRKKPDSAIYPAEKSEAAGAPPTLDNGDDDDGGSDQDKGWTKDEHKSKATIGSEGESQEGSPEVDAANKGYNNSPTGKLIPFVPKIRPFTPKPKDGSYADDEKDVSSAAEKKSQTQVSSEGSYADDAEDDDRGEAYLSLDEMTVVPTAAPVSRPIAPKANVVIRKVPIRRVKPINQEGSETESDTSIDSSPVSPVIKRVRIKRPNNSVSMLKNNIQATSSPSSTEQSSLDAVQESEPTPSEDSSAAAPPPKIEKLDIRARLRGRNRVNKLATTATPPAIETESAELDHDEVKVEHPIEEESQVENSLPAEDLSRPVIRKRMRRPMNRLPGLTRQGPSTPVGGGVQVESNENYEETSQVAQPEQPQQPKVEEQVKIMSPLRRLRRPPAARLPHDKNNNEDEANDKLNPPAPTTTTIIADDSADDSSSNVEIAEVEVKPLRTRHRIPVRRGSLRPVHPPPPKVEETISAPTESEIIEDEDAPTSESPVTVTSTYSRIRVNNKNSLLTRAKQRPTPTYKKQAAVKEDVQSTPEPEAISATDNSNTKTRTRFGVKTRMPSSKPVTQAAPEQEAEVEPASELEKEGQLSQLNESSQQERTQVHRKRVGFRRRRPQQNQHQQENQEHLAQLYQQQEKSQEYVESESSESGTSPAVWDSEHVSSEEKVTLQPTDIPAASEHEKEEQLASSETHSADEVKSGGEEDASSSKKDGDDDVDNDDDEEYEKERVHQQGSGDESDSYDLVLNQDVRKELGTQVTHATQLPHAIKSGNYESSSSTGEENADDSSSSHLERDHQYHHKKQHQKQSQEEDAYETPHKNYNTHPKYADDDSDAIGIPQQSSYLDLHENTKGAADIGGFETLELGTPDYDPNPSHLYNYYGYGAGDEEVEDEEEEESRIHMKVLDEKSNKPLALNGKGAQNEDKPEDISLTKADPHSSPESPANPPNRQRPSESIESIKDRNKRIRLKLTRPPSAYISNGDEDGADDRKTNAAPSPTTAPFSPSLQSPRPTYTGQDALLESVTQSAGSLSTTENSQQLDQFIHNKKSPSSIHEQQNSGKRNRTRVRVKLVTLPTTTVAPARVHDDNEQDGSSSEGNPLRNHHAAFRFPPFQKSKLTLVATTEAPESGMVESVVSYKPQKINFRRPTTTSTTTSTTTTTEIPPEVVISYGSSNEEHYSTMESVSNDDVIQPVKNDKPVAPSRPRITSPAKYDSKNNRFKVNAINQQSNNVSPPPSKLSERVPSTRKPQQQRIKTPEHIRQRPASPSYVVTEAPIYHQQPSTTYASQEYQSYDDEVPPMRLATPVYQPSSLVEEREPAREVVEAVRRPTHIQYEDDDANDVIDREVDTPQKLQIVEIRQQENNNPNSISYYEPSPPTKLSGKKPVPDVYEEKVVKPKGKYSSRFKVPEKFHVKKPNFSSSEPLTTEKTVVEPKPYGNVDSESKTKTKNPSYEIPPEDTANYLPPPQQQQYQYQDYNTPVQTSIDFDLEPERPAQQYYQPEEQYQVVEKEIVKPEPEVVPDIRINVNPFPSYVEVEQVAPKQPKYQEEQKYYTKFEPTTEAAPFDPFSYAVKNSQFGPFPSTEHWSGIPSASSPVLPEYLEQRKPISAPISIRFEHENDDYRKPAPVEPRPSIPMRLEPDFKLRPQEVLSTQGIKNVIVFEDDEGEYEEPLLQAPPPPPPRPLPPAVPTVIRFGTELDGNVEEVRVPQHIPTLNNMHNQNAQQQHFYNAPGEPEFIREIDENKKEVFHQQLPMNFPNRHHQLGVPPQSHHIPLPPPPPNHMEFRRPQGSHGIELQNNPEMQQPLPLPPSPPPMEPQFISIQRQPNQEPVAIAIPHLVSHNPAPIQHVAYEMKDGELIAHHQQLLLPGQVGNEQPHHQLPHHQLPPAFQNGNNNNMQFPELVTSQIMQELPKQQLHHNQQQIQHHQQQEMVQHQQQEMVQQQQPNMHIPNNGQQLMEQIVIKLERPVEQQPLPNNHQNIPQNMLHLPNGLPIMENGFKLERPLEQHHQQQLQPIKNVQLPLNPADHNIVVNVDGRPHDAPPLNQINQRPNVMSQQQHFAQPLERPVEEVIRGNPKLKAFPHPPRPQENFPDVAFDVHQVGKGREPVAQPPSPLKNSNENAKMPEGMINQVFGDPMLLRPGQYGPPPPAQQKLPQYVPFNMMNERPSRNESEKQVEMQQHQQQQQQHHQQQQQSRPLIHHPQTFQGPVKFGNHQSFRHPIGAPNSFNAPVHNFTVGSGSPAKFPQQFPHGHNANFRNPPQNFHPRPSHHRAQPQPGPQMMMMPGFPSNSNGQFGNQHLMPRMRNPNARTSRAANLTVGGEKDYVGQENMEEAVGRSDEAGVEYVPDQQSLFPVENAEIDSNSKELPQQDQLLPNSENHEVQNIVSQPQSTQSDPSGSDSDSSEANEKVSESQIKGDAMVSQRQQRELNLDSHQQPQNTVEKNDVTLTKSGNVNESGNKQEGLIMEESVRIQHFVQDKLPDASKDDLTREEPSADPLMPTKWKNFDAAASIPSESKEATEDKQNMESKERFSVSGTSLKSGSTMTLPPTNNPEKRTLTDNKKGFMMMKGVKGKNELHQQLFAKVKPGKSEKGVQKPVQGQPAINNNPGDVQEQQEFVAPKVIQRGFHPILPYSEKDPGPIVIQMLPKVEKFLPPPMDSEDGGRAETGAPLQPLSPGVGTIGSKPFNQLQDPLLYSSNKHANQIPVAANNFNTLPTNPHTQLRSLTYNTIT